RQGAKLRVQGYDPEDDRGPAKAPGADLWVIEPAWLGRCAADGVVPLPAELCSDKTGSSWSGLLPIYRRYLLRWGPEGTPVALPILGDAVVCYYRKDLFDDPRHQEAYQKQTGRRLVAPETWDDFTAIARYFHEQRQPGRKSPALPPLPRATDALDREFYLVAASLARQGDQRQLTAPAPHKDRPPTED